MKKVAVEVLTRATVEDGPLTVTFIVPDNLSIFERIGIAEALLNKLREEGSSE